MRQRRLPIFLVVFIAILVMVISRLYCKGTYQPENQEEKKQQETSSRNNTVSNEKAEPEPAGGKQGDDRVTAPSGERRGRRDNKVEPVFNRNLSKIVYSKHARCRMDCRRIDESEVLEIRGEGKINYAKSELDSNRDPKFALEGVTHDKQHVRIVFAQTSHAHVVVTCIDLDTDWACRCN
ncbi:DUF4258 domain-containing protein [Flavitalea antarctica]